mgnify:CR=1 FL=1|tara:strand:- start:644 stop:778 length:135 start_codon:yes stop_codon:yes gene_type:complete
MELLDYLRVFFGAGLSIFFFVGAFKILLELETEKDERRKNERDD